MRKQAQKLEIKELELHKVNNSRLKSATLSTKNTTTRNAQSMVLGSVDRDDSCDPSNRNRLKTGNFMKVNEDQRHIVTERSIDYKRKRPDLDERAFSDHSELAMIKALHTHRALVQRRRDLQDLQTRAHSPSVD